MNLGSARIVATLLAAFALGFTLISTAPPPILYSSPAIFSAAMTPQGETSASATTNNWAGYVVTGATGSVSDAKGSWIVPGQGMTCSQTSGYTLAWVGIDGWSSKTVEQVGTASNCVSGKAQYYAWYETYPSPLKKVSLVISPGQKVSAEVSYASGTFTMTIKDVTSGKSYSTTTNAKGASESSAEWIIEAPTSTGTTPLPLSNFGTAYIGYDNTGIASTGYATVAGKTGAIGSFSSLVQVTMVSSSTGTVKAQPSSLSSDATSFTVAWESAGP